MAANGTARVIFVLSGYGTLLRSLLWITSAVAVLCMHHTPLSGVPEPARHALAQVIDPRMIAAETMPMVGAWGEPGERASCCASPPEATQVPGHTGMPGDGHDDSHTLLHLCAAIMAAVAGLILLLFAVAWPLPVSRCLVRLPRCGGGSGRAPPLPTSRHLAVLCVLRQ